MFDGFWGFVGLVRWGLGGWGEMCVLLVGGLGCGVAGWVGGGGGMRLSLLGLNAKSEFRAKRTSDFERKKGVGGMLGGSLGGPFAVEGPVVVSEERWMPLKGRFALFHIVTAVGHSLGYIRGLGASDCSEV